MLHYTNTIELHVILICDKDVEINTEQVFECCFTIPPYLKLSYIRVLNFIE